MSATLVRPQPVPDAAAVAARPRRAIGDVHVAAALLLLFAAMTVLTWRKWGMPEIDAGAELTTADLVKHGALAYRDVRYFYGPLGLYSLALTFKLFGTSFATAYAFGLAQAAAILVAFYVLARHWLRSLTAGLATAVLLAIGFSGTAFNFVLPHTNSATLGILFLLLMLLALTRDRLFLAGAAAGLVALTRPEYAAVAAGAAVAYLIASCRVAGRSTTLHAAWRLALPGIVIPVAVLGWFAARAGLSNVLTENLWPVDFLRVSGFRTQQSFMPFDVASLFGLLARGALYAALLAALVLSAERWRHRRGAARAVAAWPVLAVLAGLGLADATLRATGLFAGQRGAIDGELHHLVIGMSVLPALGLTVAAWALIRLVRGERSPLGGTWPADLALIVAAAALGLRAYNVFTTSTYAAYYAAPLVLLLGILHQRVGDFRPQARAAVIGALGLVAAGLAAYALAGLYVHDTTPVHTPRGTFVTTAAAAPALQTTVRSIDADTHPGDRILAAPADGGLYFMADRRPALHEVMLLPGLLDSRADEADAIARMRREYVRLAVIGARDLSAWGTRTFGVDYNQLLGDYLRRSTTATATVGDVAHQATGTDPSTGFTITRLGG